MTVRNGDDMPTKPPSTNVDTAWFTRKLREAEYSQRKLARHLGIDQSALSLTLRGRRMMRMDEAAQIARLIGVPVAEVIHHAGIGTNGVERTCAVVGIVDADGLVTLDFDNPVDRVPCHDQLPDETVALQARTGGSQAAMIDGWIYYLAKPRPEGTAACLQRLSLVEFNDTSQRALRYVTRGYRPGSVTLSWSITGAEHVTESADIAWCTPVLWIQP